MRRQQQRTAEAREQILEAALDLFSHQGFRGTTVREIAERAGRSTGNLYHHFPDKETLFRTLLDRYWEIVTDPEFPINRALAQGRFPDNLEELGKASRQGVQEYRRYVALIYVDVVEFKGAHIQRFYSGIPDRFRAFVETHSETLSFDPSLRPEITPDFALMLASRIFLQYFSVEILFGQRDHFGRDTNEVVHEISNILRRGMLDPDREAGGS